MGDRSTAWEFILQSAIEPTIPEGAKTKAFRCKYKSLDVWQCYIHFGTVSQRVAAVKKIFPLADDIVKAGFQIKDINIHYPLEIIKICHMTSDNMTSDKSVTVAKEPSLKDSIQIYDPSGSQLKGFSVFHLTKNGCVLVNDEGRFDELDDLPKDWHLDGRLVYDQDTESYNYVTTIEKAMKQATELPTDNLELIREFNTIPDYKIEEIQDIAYLENMLQFPLSNARLNKIHKQKKKLLKKIFSSWEKECELRMRRSKVTFNDFEYSDE